MELQSNKVEVKASNETVYNFLKNAENIYELLPQDKVQEFKATETECSFKVQGGITISLIQDEMIPNDSIKMVSGENSPFPFNLTIHINENGEETLGFIHFDGKVNAFLKMMVKTPLENLFNYMSNKLKEKYD